MAQMKVTVSISKRTGLQSRTGKNWELVAPFKEILRFLVAHGLPPVRIYLDDLPLKGAELTLSFAGRARAHQVDDRLAPAADSDGLPTLNGPDQFWKLVLSICYVNFHSCMIAISNSHVNGLRTTRAHPRRQFLGLLRSECGSGFGQHHDYINRHEWGHCQFL